MRPLAHVKLSIKMFLLLCYPVRNFFGLFHVDWVLLQSKKGVHKNLAAQSRIFRALMRMFAVNEVTYSDRKLSSQAHSERRLVTGLATAAFIAWKLSISQI